MAKKTRIDRRGKIRSVVRSLGSGVRLHWRKQKTLAMLANRRQLTLEYGPAYTPEIEIVSGEGYAIAIEASEESFPTYIEKE